MQKNKLKTLYVGNLPDSYNEDHLNGLFKELGRIMKIRVMKDIFTGQSKGFGFVEFESPKSATLAIEKYRGQEIEGRILKLTLSKTRDKR